MPKIFAIIVSYNGLRWYERCLGSLRNSDFPVQTIVIDNASSDNSCSFIEEHFPEVILIKSKENLGFAKANNIGIRYAIDHDADYVFLLNQDAWVEKNTISELVKTFSIFENTGITVPIQLNGSYSALDDCFTGYLSKEIINDLYMKELKDHYTLSFVNAAAWMISSDCIKRVGGFDTQLFYHYGEDENYCQRIRYHSFNLVLNTHCSFCHDRGFRQGHEKEYRDKVLQVSPYNKENVVYGNINVNYDINSLIRKQIKSLFFSFISLSFPKIRKHRRMILQLKRISQSRIANMAGGLVWL
jgi:GT2 family glycosyltransferase